MKTRVLLLLFCSLIELQLAPEAQSMGRGPEHLRLKSEIADGRYQARTCVASMTADPRYNDLLWKQIHQTLSQFGYPEELHQYLVEFKSNGPQGFRDCLAGNYEDVTLFAHSADGAETNLIYQVESAEAGKYTSLFLPSKFWEYFETGRFPISKTVKQITFANCSVEALLADSPIIERIARKHGIHVKILPFEKGLEFLLDGMRVVTQVMSGIAIAESAQPEYSEDLYCLVHSSQSGFLEGGEGLCVRGRYRAEIDGVGIGMKYANRLFKLRKRPAPDLFHQVDLLAMVNLELGIRFADRMNPAAAVLTESLSYETYSLSFGLFERVSLIEQTHCYESADALSRLVCMGNIEVIEAGMNDGWISREDLSHLNADDRAPIHIAAANNDVEMIKFLEGQGVSLTLENSKGWTTLFFAAFHGSHEVLWHIKNRLKSAPAEYVEEVLNAQEHESGNNALQIAIGQMAHKRYHHTFNALIDMRVDVTQQNNSGQNFLHQMAEHNSWSSVYGCTGDVRYKLKRKHQYIARKHHVYLPEGY